MQINAEVNDIAAATKQAAVITAEARLLEAQNKGQLEGQKFIMQMAQESEEFRAKMQLEAAKLAQDGDQFAATLAKDLTKLELDSNKDVPGALI